MHRDSFKEGLGCGEEREKQFKFEKISSYSSSLKQASSWSIFPYRNFIE